MIVNADQPKSEVSRFNYGELHGHTLEMVTFALNDGRLVYGVRAFKFGEHLPVVTHSVATDLCTDEEEAKIEIYRVLGEWVKQEEKRVRPLSPIPFPFAGLDEGARP